MEKSSGSDTDVAAMSQVDWDEVNAAAQSRKGRALELLADLPETHIELPEEASETAPKVLGSFARPNEILQRARNLGICQEIAAVPDNPYRPWDGPVDWSECVAREVGNLNDLSGESQLVIELRERGIDLRDDNVAIQPSAANRLAQARRSRVFT